MPLSTCLLTLAAPDAEGGVNQNTDSIRIHGVVSYDSEARQYVVEVQRVTRLLAPLRTGPDLLPAGGAEPDSQPAVPVPLPVEG